MEGSDRGPLVWFTEVLTRDRSNDRTRQLDVPSILVCNGEETSWNSLSILTAEFRSFLRSAQVKSQLSLCKPLQACDHCNISLEEADLHISAVGTASLKKLNLNGRERHC